MQTLLQLKETDKNQFKVETSVNKIHVLFFLMHQLLNKNKHLMKIGNFHCFDFF